MYFVYFNNYLNTCITLPKIIIFIISLFNFIIIIIHNKKCGFNNKNKGGRIIMVMIMIGSYEYISNFEWRGYTHAEINYKKGCLDNISEWGSRPTL